MYAYQLHDEKYPPLDLPDSVADHLEDNAAITGIDSVASISLGDRILQIESRLNAIKRHYCDEDGCDIDVDSAMSDIAVEALEYLYLREV